VLSTVILACGGAAQMPVTPQATTAAVTPTTTTVAAVTSPESVLDQGLPRSSSYSFIDVTVNEAVFASVEPRTYLRDERAAGARHLFLEITLDNTSDADVANWPPNPFALQLGNEFLGPPEIVEGRPNIGLTQLATTEMVLAFAVPDDAGFEDASLVVAQPDRVPMILPLTGEIAELGYPMTVPISGEGPAQSVGVGCRQSLEVEVLGGNVAIDLLGTDYPTTYGARRAKVGERFLSLGLRVLNNGGSRCGAGGTNFGNHDVRLHIDEVPREPITWVNTAIGLDVAEDLSFDFAYPIDATALTLTVGSEEATLFTIPVPVPRTPPLPGEILQQ